MTAPTTPPVQGTHAPSPIELTWERYKSIVYVVLIAAVGALAANYGIKKYNQGKTDERWSTFAATTGLEKSYTGATPGAQTLVEAIEDVDAAALRTAIDKAPDEQKPWLLLALARKEIAAENWAAAEAALGDLEAKYPHHSLVKTSAHPFQAQEPVPQDDLPPGQKPKGPEWKPPVAGSAISQMRAEIEAGKAFVEPPQFAKHEVPPDATKVKFELSDDRGSFTIALMPQTEQHRAAFLELARAEKPFWEGLAIDEIRRPTDTIKQPAELHLGLASSRNDDRELWTATEPSTKIVEFEQTTLSHFEGAVSARQEKDGKSSAERFWIVCDDAPRYDGERVVFAYVVEGLDVLEQICTNTGLSEQEDPSGRGRPMDTIRVTKVTVLE